MMINSNNIGILGIIAGIGGLAYSWYQGQKISGTAKKLDLSLEDISKKTPVEIQRSIVDCAVEKAIDREVRLIVSDIARTVRNDVHNEIASEVRKEVDKQYKSLSEEVSDRISDQVANIDEYALKESVTKQAEKKILKKFDGALDGVLGDFNRKLGTVSKIYESIEDTLRGRRNDDGKNVTLRLD